MDTVLVNHLLSGLVFSVLGLLVFAVGFYLFDKLTPFRLWHEIVEEHNTALAILVGSTALGISIIIAAAIG